MTTAAKLWLGFGTLTALLVLSSVTIIVRIRAIEGQMGEMALAREDAAQHDLQTIEGFALTLLIVGVVIAVLTSGVISRGVVKAERRLEDARQFADSIVETVEKPLLVLDGNLRVMRVNRSYYQTFKVTPKETENRLLYELGNGQWNIPKLRTLLEDVLPRHNEVHDYEVDHDFPGIGVRIMRLNARCLHRSSNNATLILLTVLDITDRERVEAAVKVSEVRYRRLFETAKDGILILDADTAKITEANPYIGELLGFAHAELLGKELWEIGLFKDQEASKAAVRELQEKHYIRYEDLPLETKAGRRADVEFVSNVYREGEHPVIQCNIRNMTERKRLEDELRRVAADMSEADRRKNEFLAMLAHELRNPLAPIRNALQIMKLTGGNGQAVASASEMMERQVGQMVRLVDDLLDVSRISRGKIELRRGRIELAAAVNHAVEAVRSLFKDMNNELIVTLPPRPVYLNADPTRLAQVVGNLLNNACKFTHTGGRISLTVELEGQQAVIRVRDTGIGIAADQLSRIFDIFVQVDTSLERSATGLGIGLMLVKSLVEMHDGTVEVHSAGVGHGSEFVVRLPIMDEAPKPRPPEPAVSEPAITTARRILVVDDNRDAAISLAMLLKLTGNETHTAFDGLEAVAASATFRPDVVLCDIGLPKLNGYEACRRIREQPWSNGIVLVALTGWGQEEDRDKSRAAGFDAHMVKPVDLVALTKLLAELTATKVFSGD